MEATINIGGLIKYILLGWRPSGDDEAMVIGDSRVAYLASRDPGHIFIPAALWHDAAYRKGASIQEEWPRWRVDEEFLHKMLFIAEGNVGLEKEALTLYLIVREFGQSLFEGKEEIL